MALPLLVVLVLGAFELGRALLVYRSMGEALRAGARSLAREPDASCQPRCSAGAARALALASDLIAENTRLPRRAISVTPLASASAGQVGLAAEVSLATDLLGGLGLDRLIVLRAERYEARLGR